MKTLLPIVLVALGAPAMAQKAPNYDPSVLVNCSENAENIADRTYCIGQAADACTRTEAGQSTVGIGYCFSEEWQQWDDRLNTAYQALLTQQAEVAEDNAAYNENIPDAVVLLRDMQRGWVVYRDHACDWELVQWGGGTGGGPASAACMMRLTALQTLFLEGHL